MRLFCFITSQVTNSKLAARAQNLSQRNIPKSREIIQNFIYFTVIYVQI